MLAAIANGPVEVRNPLRGDDTDALLEAIDALGVDTSIKDHAMRLGGGGPGQPRRERLDLGLGGAPARFTLALATLASGSVVVDGASRLRQRPMGDAVDLLRALGARLEPLDEDGRLPIRVLGSAQSPWANHTITVGATATSQVISALLLVAPAAGGIEVVFDAPPTSASYIELTLRSLESVGVSVRRVLDAEGALRAVSVDEGRPQVGVFEVAADASSGAAAAAMACALPGAKVHLSGVVLDDGQPDTAALSLLAAAGARIEAVSGGVDIDSGEALRFPPLVDAELMPDAVPSLAVLAAVRSCGPVRFTGLHTLRVKECDRVEATAQVIRLLGGSVLIEGDDLCITPMELTQGMVELPTFDDHRMAMAGAVAGLWRGQVRIDDPDVVSKSWPTFWIDTAPLGGWGAA
ncbi:MAG: hypothetical protein MK101_04505 [Phycisphaerales bacterium]|nr:hypothetical protein [Phycisphaerales bacterium]